MTSRHVGLHVAVNPVCCPSALSRRGPCRATSAERPAWASTPRAPPCSSPSSARPRASPPRREGFPAPCSGTRATSGCSTWERGLRYRYCTAVVGRFDGIKQLSSPWCLEEHTRRTRNRWVRRRFGGWSWRRRGRRSGRVHFHLDYKRKGAESNQSEPS